MKKKILCLLLALCVGVFPAVLTACVDGEPDPGGSAEYTIVDVPVLSFDASANKVTDASIATDTFAIAYEEGKEVTVAIGEGGVTASEPTSATEGGVTTDTYTFTATAVGNYTVNITTGGETDTVTYNVAPAYPGLVFFDAFSSFGTNNMNTTTANIHDPCIVEADGKYYVFQTDNYTEYGYTIRESENLINWKYAGAAIPGFNVNGAPPRADTMSESNELWDVYQIINKMTDWKENCWTLWAPEVVPAADGGYWLYASWTSAFGSPQSIIFLCHADEVTGPYELVYTDNGEPAVIANSHDGGNPYPNAIDASIYYDTEGNMYMSYGSFSGGIYCIELDPETGLRKDGKTSSDLAGYDDKAGRYGTCLAANRDTEGSVITYHEDVEISSYDGTGEYTPGETKDLYYMMSSSNSLSTTYNMRGYSSATATGTYGATAGGSSTGTRVSGSFSWRTSATDNAINFDFYAPGHNDMIRTSTGRNLLAYHNRIGFGTNNHYLFLSTYAFNSRGDLVMNPNRYAGEVARKITAAEIYTLSDTYSFAAVTNNNVSASFNKGYAMEGMQLREDGSIYFNNAAVGTWKLYGDNYVLIDLTSTIDGASGGAITGKYYGVAFPAYIEKEQMGGISISCVSENGANTLYLNMMDLA